MCVSYGSARLGFIRECPTPDVTMPIRGLRETLAALVAERVEFIVFGAVALMAHGLVRATEDLDIFVRADAENIARLRAALMRVYPDDPAIDEIVHADLAGDYPAIR